MSNENKQLEFYFDQSRCMGCNTCTVACKDWNQVNPGHVRWRKQETYEVNETFLPFAMGCNHCKEPACMPACAAGAITKDENGIVHVNRDYCIGMKLCITACPFAKPQLADDVQEPNQKETWVIEHPVQKCTSCPSRRERDGKPTCVLSCPARALDFGYDMQSKYPDAVRLNEAEFPYMYAIKGAKDTVPSIFIKKKTAPLAVVKTSANYDPDKRDV